MIIHQAGEEPASSASYLSTQRTQKIISFLGLAKLSAVLDSENGIQSISQEVLQNASSRRESRKSLASWPCQAACLFGIQKKEHKAGGAAEYLSMQRMQKVISLLDLAKLHVLVGHREWNIGQEVLQRTSARRESRKSLAFLALPSCMPFLAGRAPSVGLLVEKAVGTVEDM